MDYSLLATCLAVYRSGSLTKAARLLGVSQPAVTGQIRSLESVLGCPLFTRCPSGAVPTDAAHELVRDTAEALDALQAAVSRRLSPESPADRTVHLAGPSEVLSCLVLPALTGPIAAGLRLRLSFGLTDELLAGLAEGRYDLVVCTRRDRGPAVSCTPLMDEEFALVGHRRWTGRIPPGAVAREGAAALAGAPLISYADNLPIIRRYWRSVFGHPPTAAPQVTAPDLRAVLAAVRAGAGISVLPTYLYDDADELVVLHHPPEPPLNTLYLATRTTTAPTRALAAVRAHLLSQAAAWR